MDINRIMNEPQFVIKKGFFKSDHKNRPFPLNVDINIMNEPQKLKKDINIWWKRTIFSDHFWKMFFNENLWFGHNSVNINISHKRITCKKIIFLKNRFLLIIQVYGLRFCTKIFTIKYKNL